VTSVARSTVRPSERRQGRATARGGRRRREPGCGRRPHVRGRRPQHDSGDAVRPLTSDYGLKLTTEPSPKTLVETYSLPPDHSIPAGCVNDVTAVTEPVRGEMAETRFAKSSAT